MYREPRHPYTLGLLNSFPPLHGPKQELTGIPGAPPDLQALPSGCRFHARCPYVLDKCKTDTPVLDHTGVPGESNRRVACWLNENESLLPAPLHITG
jgi:peptide/nickel transport system ATP-binding protein